MSNSFTNPWLKKAGYFLLGALLVAFILDAITPSYGMYGARYGVMPPGTMSAMVTNGSGWSCSGHMGMHGRYMGGHSVPMYTPYIRP
ncbi:hypothetical protein M7775_13420 [Sporomusa sphaeroides DSM 2875]|uniref:hypothetical protein n=1 Tax=Sporomusa sphaeroides TaxID=47679 RepID=UPI00202F664A|nr:hypothetical protein [Sporomusa sphaeroides]MCM0759552.1 hypothetical protein [Sporomusa sphaeroides DSM 2875]